MDEAVATYPQLSCSALWHHRELFVLLAAANESHWTVQLYCGASSWLSYLMLTVLLDANMQLKCW